jgi:hypothetical protein
VVREVGDLLQKKNKKVLREYEKKKDEIPENEHDPYKIAEILTDSIKYAQYPWGVRACGGCRTVHNRDVNACRNMLYLAFNIILGTMAHSHYTRGQPITRRGDIARRRARPRFLLAS